MIRRICVSSQSLDVRIRMLWELEALLMYLREYADSFFFPG